MGAEPSWSPIGSCPAQLPDPKTKDHFPTQDHIHIHLFLISSGTPPIFPPHRDPSKQKSCFLKTNYRPCVTDCKTHFSLFVEKEWGRMRTTPVMVWEQSYTHKHSFSCPSFFCFLCGGCFCRRLTETQEQLCSALRCLPQKGQSREDLTAQQPASKPLLNQALMDKILNRLKWFVGWIFFWHYLFWSETLLAPEWQPIDHTSLKLKLLCHVQMSFEGSGHDWYSNGAQHSTCPCTQLAGNASQNSQRLPRASDSGHESPRQALVREPSLSGNLFQFGCSSSCPN